MTTKVFISWSGDLSRQIGEAVRKWLPRVLQSVKPYFTPDDIEKGARWNSDIALELESSNIGIICLTKNNLEKPWILFEAGALSKSFEISKVCPVLFGVDTSDYQGPLNTFQNTNFNKEDFFKLVKSINAECGELELSETDLSAVYDKWWPDLENEIKLIIEEHSKSEATVPSRSDSEILREILELTRLAAKDVSLSDIETERFVISIITNFAELLDSIQYEKNRAAKNVYRHLVGNLLEFTTKMKGRGHKRQMMIAINKIERFYRSHFEEESELVPESDDLSDE